jgi:hypothetical protein
LDHATALHWVLHSAAGAAVLNRVNLSADETADLLVRAASMHRAEKRNEVTKMDSTTRILKNVSSMGELEYTRIISDYAKTVYPSLSRERAFAKVFEDPDSIGIRRLWQVAKGQVVADEPNDDDEADDTDALDELNKLAEQERRRSGTSKAVAFSKVYCDPANVELVKRERRANRPRA